MTRTDDPKDAERLVREKCCAAMSDYEVGIGFPICRYPDCGEDCYSRFVSTKDAKRLA
jgi:hypothetical protein